MSFLLFIIILAILILYTYARFLRTSKQQPVFPQLQKPFIFAHQGYQLKVTKANDPRLAQFLKKYEQG